ncbi:FdrA family protein [Nocardioides alkalitolerans]|uniref:FdrA family protein n=1 Tax=Nocardioides alkalitolerans TaxID=281714 RepID=UPI0004248685|nr:FdrA family protein [Nocardioides alkalitolerans]
MSHEHVEVRAGAYADSVALLQVSRTVAGTPGVEAAQVAMATDLNLEVLAQMGFTLPATTPDAMVVALRLADADALPAALAAVDAALVRRRSDTTAEVAPHRTTRAALREHGGDLALVSVPGSGAFLEAMDALDADRDVMVFSDNVPLAQEVALKRTAAERGLLVMGPDCGTAVVGGVGLGFANVVEPGPVGLVAASGTGCQQLLALLDRAGVGVASALGVGGRDLSAEVGGLATLEALRRLDADPAVEVIVLVSKPPAPEVGEAVERAAAALSTPVELALLGPGRADLTEVAERVVTRLGLSVDLAPSGTARAAVDGTLVRGLYVGGTLAQEAALLLADGTGTTVGRAAADLAGPGHAVVDFGDDELTVGRAHPMIDPTLRDEHLARVLADPATGAVVLDVVLGHGAEADPAAGLAPLVAGSAVPVVVALVGTRGDPQGHDAQAAALVAAGAEVHPSNAAAVRRALALALSPAGGAA